MTVIGMLYVELTWGLGEGKKTSCCEMLHRDTELAGYLPTYLPTYLPD